MRRVLGECRVVGKVWGEIWAKGPGMGGVDGA